MDEANLKLPKGREAMVFYRFRNVTARPLA
jgi:hypothetical protein